MHVYEAGTDAAAARVDRDLRIGTGQILDRRDPVPVYSDVPGSPFGSGSVED